MKCPNCATELPQGATKCTSCGALIVRGKYCPYCRAVIPATATVCSHCGKPQPQITALDSSADSQKKSVLLLISAIWGVLYGIYIVYYVLTAGSSAESAAEALGFSIAAAMIMPHMICAVLAALFNLIGWALNSRGLTLTGAILYAVAAVLMPLYALFVLVQMILSFIGFARLKR